MAPMLKRDVHYEVDERKRTVGVTEEGVALVEDQLGIDNLYEAANTPLVGYLNNALKVKELFKRDKDYIVRERPGAHRRRVHRPRARTAVATTRACTRRSRPRRAWRSRPRTRPWPPSPCRTTSGSTTKLSGMTGTAQTEAAELHQIYKLRRAVDPDEQADGPRRPGRPDLQDRRGEVRRGRGGHRGEARQGPAGAGRHHQRGEVRVPVEAARPAPGAARGAQREAARARGRRSSRRPGHAGAVTVATNMAGRGTDIVLGGNPEFLADLELRSRGLDPVETARGVRGGLGRRSSTR